MNSYGTYSPALVFSLRESTSVNGRKVLPDGKRFRYSDRIELFEVKGMSCVTCGLTGEVFLLQGDPAVPHLNLYARNGAGKLILMTKDHIIPKSKGGRNRLSNYNTMCSPCNARKADKMPEGYALAEASSS